MSATLIIAGIVTVAQSYSALVGAGTSIYGFYKHFTRLSEVEESINSLLEVKESLEATKIKPYSLKSEPKEFFDYFLSKAQVLFPYIKRKLVKRLVFAIGTIIGAQIVGPQLQQLTSHHTLVTAIQAALQFSAGVFVRPDSLVGTDEAKFLKYMMALQDMFHDEYVLPAVRSFNALLAYLTDDRFLKLYELKGNNWANISQHLKLALAEPDRFKAEIEKLTKPTGSAMSVFGFFAG